MTNCEVKRVSFSFLFLKTKKTNLLKKQVHTTHLLSYTKYQKLSEEELNGIAFCIMKTTFPKMCYNNTKNGRFDFTVQDNKSYYDVIKKLSRMFKRYI